MSRTFRRKDYETKRISRPGSKVAGYYTVQEGWWGYGRVATFREPTRQEYFEEYWKLHGDNHRNDYSPSRNYREIRQSENRSINKEELCKWMKNPDHDPLFEANPRSHWWDWS